MGARVLVAISDFGGRPEIVDKVISCFPSSFFQVLLFSTERGEYIFKKDIGEDLPFVHRAVFADEIENYDYFFFTENDLFYPIKTLDTVFSRFHEFGENFPLGMIRQERGQLIDFASVANGSKIKGKSAKAFQATNDHQGSYLLSRAQLQRAIDTGNYLVHPSALNGYGKLETAASSVYFNCGLSKVYPIHGLENLLVDHMGGIYKSIQPEYKLENLTADVNNWQNE